MSAAMEDQIWREIGGLESGFGELDERLGKAERDLVNVQNDRFEARRAVAVALISLVGQLAFYALIIWLVRALISFQPASTAASYCI